MNIALKSILSLLVLLLPSAAFGEHLVRGVVRGVQIYPENLLVFTIEGGKPRCPRYKEFFYRHKDASQVKSILSFLMTSKISSVRVSLIAEDNPVCDYNGIEGVSRVIFGDL